MFKPTMVRVSFALILFSLTFLFLSPLLGVVYAVPCKNLDTNEWLTCPINPYNAQGSTYYLGHNVLDLGYQFVYIAALLAMPYIIACISMEYYSRFVERLTSVKIE